ncbi:MAG: hypothetical protein Q9159_000754 [Coniocarpon cinnabarinum]
MEPLSAIALAGNILQFTDSASKLFKESVHLYRGTSKPERAELALVKTNLAGLMSKLQSRVAEPHPHAEGSLLAVAAQCEAVGQELEDGLARLEVGDQETGFRRAVKSVRQGRRILSSKDRIESLQKRLNNLRAQAHSDSGMTRGAQVHQKQTLDQASETLRRLESQNTTLFTKLDTISALICENISSGRQAFDNISALQPGSEEPDNVEARSRLNTFNDRITRLEQSLSETSLWERPRGDISDISWSERLMGLFRFPTVNTRERNIEKAQEDTYKWFIEGCTEAMWESREIPKERAHSKADPCGFREWLESGHGIFRIVGKPGSGKSTLTKMLVSNSTCHSLIEKWAHDKTLFTIKFFAFKSGDEMQHSIRGFLQSVLLQVFEQDSDYAVKVFKKHRWHQVLACTSSDVSARFAELPLSVDELTQLWQEFIQSIEQRGKVCLFLDGLDEFADAIPAMTRFLEGIAHVSYLKIFIAARDLQAFDDHFGEDKVILHEWTRFDIEGIVRQAFYSHTAVRARASVEEAAFESLIEEILKSAAGVILWVKAVVASLLEGFREGDTLAELQHRLTKMPTKLNDLYQSILDDLPTEHRREALQILNFVRACSREEFFCTVELLISWRNYSVANSNWLAESLNESDHLRASFVDTMKRRTDPIPHYVSSATRTEPQLAFLGIACSSENFKLLRLTFVEPFWSSIGNKRQLYILTWISFHDYLSDSIQDVRRYMHFNLVHPTDARPDDRHVSSIDVLTLYSGLWKDFESCQESPPGDSQLSPRVTALAVSCDVVVLTCLYGRLIHFLCVLVHKGLKYWKYWRSTYWELLPVVHNLWLILDTGLNPPNFSVNLDTSDDKKSVSTVEVLQLTATAFEQCAQWLRAENAENDSWYKDTSCDRILEFLYPTIEKLKGKPQMVPEMPDLFNILVPPLDLPDDWERWVPRA